MSIQRVTRRTLLAFPAVLGLASAARAQPKYDPGVSDTEIKIGSIGPTSGPASAYGVAEQVYAAYFRMINERGGINGRKINFIFYDDGYNPPKTVEMARRLVENDGVLLLFGTTGTAPNAAIQKYMNIKKVPQLFIGSNSSRWSDPEHFPYSVGWGVTYRNEARSYARYLLETMPDARIGVLYQNDDLGRELQAGMREGLGARAATMIAAEISYEVTSPTVDSEVLQLKGAGATVLFSATTPKFTAQVIRRINSLGWKPLHIVGLPGSYISAAIKPVGFDISQGIVSSSYWKDPLDSQWANDPGMNEWRGFMNQYLPGITQDNTLYGSGYMFADATVRVLTAAGDDLTRDNIMKVARSMKDWEFGLLLPGIKINTGPSQPTPISQTRLMRIKGEQWELFGPLISS
jgi:branched-chain amino acid transport system substrate-binding protein